MKHFYAGTFINRNDLKSIGIEYPIKLEYYKIKPNIEVIKNENEVKYGIEVIKTSYINEKTKVENIEIKEFTKDETIVNKILDILKRNEVTPISAKYIVEDLLKEIGNRNEPKIGFI